MERKFQWNHQPFADVDAYEIGIISGLLMSMNTVIGNQFSRQTIVAQSC